MIDVLITQNDRAKHLFSTFAQIKPSLDDPIMENVLEDLSSHKNYYHPMLKLDEPFEILIRFSDGTEVRLKHEGLKKSSYLTENGLKIFGFEDTYKRNCSIQESSFASEPRIWFGMGKDPMHLDIEKVEEILPILSKFVETGSL